MATLKVIIQTNTFFSFSFFSLIIGTLFSSGAESSEVTFTEPMLTKTKLTETEFSKTSEYSLTGLITATSVAIPQKINEKKIDSLHQQDIRLMLDKETDSINYEIHSVITTQQSSKPYNAISSSNIFQLSPLRIDFSDSNNKQNKYYGYIDRLNLKANFDNVDFRIGRQAISWGVGRFWQPNDIFGAFNATELVRDYKPGIDILDFNYYPDDFSNLNLVYVFSKNSDSNVGLRYSRPFNEQTYLSILIANITAKKNNTSMIGGSIESEWHGAGVRIESLYSAESSHKKSSFYSVAGFDYQFSNEWILTSEVYYNSLGANQLSEFSKVIYDDDFQAGLLKQLSQQLFAISLTKSVTPLITVNYLWLSAILLGQQNDASSLIQLSAVYSLGNESDIRITTISTSGKKADINGVPQSEFGYIPSSLSLQFRLYF